MSQTAYTGRDNLDVMADAVNYNQFLIGLITTAMPMTGKILDFGAGVGTFDDPVRATGRDVECAEIDPPMVTILKEHGYTVWSDLAAIPDSRFAGVYTLNVLEHIEDDIAACQALYTKLAPGGVLLIYVPAFPILFSSMDRKVGHFRRYRKTPTVAYLQKIGYTIQTARYVDTLGFLASLVYKLLGRNDGSINRRALTLFDRWIFPLNRLLDPLCSRWFGKNLLIIARK